MKKDFSYDFTALKSMSMEELKKALPKLTKVANERLRQLEKHQSTQYAYRYAQKVSKNKEKARFKTSFKNSTKSELFNQMLYLEKFLNARSSTITGVHEIRSVQDQFFSDMAKSSGYNFDFYENKKSFFDFLKSSEYKNARNYLDSDQVFDLYFEFEDVGLSPDEIIDQFKNFNEGNKSYYEIRQENLSRYI